MKNAVIAILSVISIGLSLLLVSGCNGTLVQLKEPEFNQGCYMSTIGAKLGYLNQEGTGEMYKVKCSPKLPKNYCYQVDNQASGVKAKVGNCE